MDLLPATAEENGENSPSLSEQRWTSKRCIDTGHSVLGTNYRLPHANSSPQKRGDSRNTRSSLRGGARKKQKVVGDTSSSASLDLNLNATLGEQECPNNENGVCIRSPRTQAHIRDGTLPKPCDRAENSPYEPFPRTQRSSLQRRSNIQLPPEECSISIRDGSTLSPAQNKSPVVRRPRPIPIAYFGTKCSATTKRRNIVMIMSLGLALLGCFVEIRQMMNFHASGGNLPSDWIMSLPRFGSTSGWGRSGQNGNVMEDAYFPPPPHNIRSMEAERKRVHSRSKSRAETRRMRTKPPSTYPTIPVAATVSGGAAPVIDVLQGISPPAPRLILDLPAHRELDNVKADHSYQKSGSDNGAKGRPLLVQTKQTLQQPESPCGPQAKEASQHSPNHYPESAYVGPKSRIVVTGALSQVGMELIIQLHEQCRVQFIVGIDAACPNTRHERIDMIESRYQYIQRRVPGFQRLEVPMFGIHPHPKMGEERLRESAGNGFDLVSRLKPTHIVHLAGMEEGRGEYIEYGDTVDASPFADGGKRSMMRRFDSLLSTDQVFSSVAKFNKLQEEDDMKPQPQLVYVSSNEAHDQSGVVLKNGAAVPYPASVYGMVCILREVLASYYHRHHGVDSVGLRVPTIFGPFSRPGSLLHDLTERTVRNAAGKEGVPKYHLDRDRYELNSMWPKREGAPSGVSEQMVYVYDVASAIVAAMQFKKNGGSKSSIDPSSGPTLIRLGSQMTLSMNDLKARMTGYLPSADQQEMSEATPASSLLEKKQDANNGVLDGLGLSTYDTERNQDLIGWAPETGTEGIKSMLAWQVLKAFPFGLPEFVPSHAAFLGLLEDSHDSLSHHSLPCAAGCRWGGHMCSKSPWDAVIGTTKEITKKCSYVIYTVDLRPELVDLERQSTPSQRKGWEDFFCKIAFVSASSKLAEKVYASELNGNVPIGDWNGKGRAGNWIIVALHGSQYTMPEYERSMAKLTPTNLFSNAVEKAMYVDHRRVILSTDQAMGVMSHMEMNSRNTPKKHTITDKKTQESRDIYLQPQPHRHSIFFTNKYSFADDVNYNSATALARFVMSNNGIAETNDIRNQMQFYEHSSHLTRTNTLRSPNYQELVTGDNLFPYDFLRSTWLVHTLKSEEGRHLRCEMYEEHSLWGNAGMEDFSMGYVLAKHKIKMQLGRVAETQYDGPEEWYPLLIPREPHDDGAISEGSVYLDYLEAAQKVATDRKGHEYYVTFLPQKRKEKQQKKTLFLKYVLIIFAK